MQRGERRIARGFSPVRRHRSGEKQHEHDAENRPPLALTADHAAKHIGQRRAQREDQQDLDQVAQRAGVLERMRGVGVEEATTIRPQHLDHFLGGDRPLRDHLFGAFQRRRLGIGVQVLRHAERHEHQRAHDGDRQQHVQRAAGHIDPEIADGLHRGPRETANQRDGERDAGGGADKIMHRQSGHLHQIAHGGFGHVRLPVRVGDETDRGVERQIGRHRIERLRIERQQRLQALQPVQHDEAGEAERQHGDRVGDPMLFLRFIDTADAVQPAFQRPQHRRKQGALAVEYPGHVAAERFGQ